MTESISSDRQDAKDDLREAGDDAARAADRTGDKIGDAAEHAKDGRGEGRPQAVRRDRGRHPRRFGRRRPLIRATTACVGKPAHTGSDRRAADVCLLATTGALETRAPRAEPGC